MTIIITEYKNPKLNIRTKQQTERRRRRRRTALACFYCFSSLPPSLSLSLFAVQLSGVYAIKRASSLFRADLYKQQQQQQPNPTQPSRRLSSGSINALVHTDTLHDQRTLQARPPRPQFESQAAAASTTRTFTQSLIPSFIHITEKHNEHKLDGEFLAPHTYRP